MTQEEFMDVVALRRQGWTITDIAAEIGHHPETVSKWLKQGGPPARRQVAATVIDGRWVVRIDQLLERNPNLLATSVARILAAEGFGGSYPTLVRHLRSKRGIRRGRTTSATMPIQTTPGEEAQIDWSDCTDWGARFGLGPLHCFGAILCWSRHRFWWFAASVDRAHSLEGLVRCFEDAGGVPGVVRIDNMGALVARAHPRLVLHPPAVAAELDRLVSFEVPQARHPGVLCNLRLAQAERSRLETASDQERWQTAATAWERLERPFETAYARFREAEALLAAATSRPRAEQILRGAHQTAVMLGAVPLRREIELLAQRGRLRLEQPVDTTAAPTAPSSAATSLGLTQREMGVLALVAEGRTNRQIG